MGRPPLGDRAMTNAERKRHWREAHRIALPWESKEQLEGLRRGNRRRWGSRPNIRELRGVAHKGLKKKPRLGLSPGLLGD
jgi:hypothetical protein